MPVVSCKISGQNYYAHYSSPPPDTQKLPEMLGFLIAGTGPGEISGDNVAKNEPVGLHCPGCGEPPVMLMDGGHQAFCGTDDCPFVTWDPTLSMAELNRDAGVIDLREGGDRGQH